MFTIADPPLPVLRRVLRLVVVITACALVVFLLSGGVALREYVGVATLLVVASLLSANVVRLGSSRAGGVLITVLAISVPYFALDGGFGPIQVGILGVMVTLSGVLYGRPGIVVSVGVAAAMSGLAAWFVDVPRPPVFLEWVVVGLLFGITGAMLWWRHQAEDEARVAALRGASALLEQETKYAELVRNAPDGVVSIGVDGRLRSASPAVARLTDFEDDELLGRCLWELPWWDDDSRTALAERFTNLLAGEDVTWPSLRAMHRSGEEGWFEVRARLVRNTDGTMAVHATLRDVSELERAQQARRAYEQGLQQAERVELMGRLAGSVAHDFNNLLAVISANAELLSRAGMAGDPQRLQDLRTAAELGARLTRKLMSLTQSQGLDLGVLDVGGVLRGVEPVLRSALPSSIELSMHVDFDTPPIAAGPTHLEQILVNLAVNARDAMPNGGKLSIQAGPTRTSNPVEEPQWVRVVVQDTGVGIGPEHRALVFEPFFSTKGNQGTGLGLASVLSILQQIGGHVDLQSQVGEGTTFTLYFRAGDASESTTEVVEAPLTFPTFPQGGSVLLVEDGDHVRRATRRSLSHLGYDVVEVASVSGALAELEQSLPDVILSDVDMPRHTGVDLMREVRERWPAIAVVLMSAHASVSGAEEADAFMAKPFSIADVASALERGRDAARDRWDNL